MTLPFELKIDPAGRKCSTKVNGKEVPGVRRNTLVTNVHDITTLTIEMVVLQPYEVNGDAEIVIDNKIVDKEIARMVYESLKEIFEKGEKNGSEKTCQ